MGELAHIELEQGWQTEKQNDATIARYYLFKIRSQALKVQELSGKYKRTFKAIDEYLNLIKTLEYKINNYRSDINIAKIEASIAKDEKKRTKFYQFKKRRHIKHTIDTLYEHIEDMKKILPKHIKNLQACKSSEPLTKIKAYQQEKKKALSSGIFTLYSLIQDYRNIRSEYIEKYGENLPAVNLSDIITRNSNFDISVSTDAIPSIVVNYSEPSLITNYIDEEEVTFIESI